MKKASEQDASRKRKQTSETMILTECAMACIDVEGFKDAGAVRHIQ
jgi:hypothetical protein